MALGIIPSVSSETYTSLPIFSSIPAILKIEKIKHRKYKEIFSDNSFYSCYVYVFPEPVWPYANIVAE